MKYKKYLEKLLTKYDKEVIFKEFEDYLSEKYEKLLDEEKKDFNIPAYIFCNALSPFESLTKYLHENASLGFSEIGRLLKKERQVAWTTYKRASRKLPARFSEKQGYVSIPLPYLVSDNLSIAELAVVYLKETAGMGYSEIGTLVGKDPRTIWTLYSRARKKGGGRK